MGQPRRAHVDQGVARKDRNGQPGGRPAAVRRLPTPAGRRRAGQRQRAADATANARAGRQADARRADQQAGRLRHAARARNAQGRAGQARGRGNAGDDGGRPRVPPHQGRSHGRLEYAYQPGTRRADHAGREGRPAHRPRDRGRPRDDQGNARQAPAGRTRPERTAARVLPVPQTAARKPAHRPGQRGAEGGDHGRYGREAPDRDGDARRPRDDPGDDREVPGGARRGAATGGLPVARARCDFGHRAAPNVGSRCPVERGAPDRQPRRAGTGRRARGHQVDARTTSAAGARAQYARATLPLPGKGSAGRPGHGAPEARAPGADHARHRERPPDGRGHRCRSPDDREDDRGIRSERGRGAHPSLPPVGEAAPGGPDDDPHPTRPPGADHARRRKRPPDGRRHAGRSRHDPGDHRAVRDQWGRNAQTPISPARPGAAGRVAQHPPGTGSQGPDHGRRGEQAVDGGRHARGPQEGRVDRRGVRGEHAAGGAEQAGGLRRHAVGAQAVRTAPADAVGRDARHAGHRRSGAGRTGDLGQAERPPAPGRGHEATQDRSARGGAAQAGRLSVEVGRPRQRAPDAGETLRRHGIRARREGQPAARLGASGHARVDREVARGDRGLGLARGATEVRVLSHLHDRRLDDRGHASAAGAQRQADGRREDPTPDRLGDADRDRSRR